MSWTLGVLLVALFGVMSRGDATSCQPPPTVPHTTRTNDEKHEVGATVRYGCHNERDTGKEYYENSGDTERKCLKNGKWSGTDLECLPKIGSGWYKIYLDCGGNFSPKTYCYNSIQLKDGSISLGGDTTWFVRRKFRKPVYQFATQCSSSCQIWTMDEGLFVGDKRNQTNTFELKNDGDHWKSKEIGGRYKTFFRAKIQLAKPDNLKGQYVIATSEGKVGYSAEEPKYWWYFVHDYAPQGHCNCF